MSFIDDIKNKKPIFGYDVTVKKIKNEKVSLVYAASNFPKKERLNVLAKTMGVKLIELKENSRELGILCKKPFPISVISFE